MLEQLSRTYELMRRYSEATAMIDRALALTPNNPVCGFDGPVLIWPRALIFSPTKCTAHSHRRETRGSYRLRSTIVRGGEI